MSVRVVAGLDAVVGVCVGANVAVGLFHTCYNPTDFI